MLLRHHAVAILAGLLILAPFCAQAQQTKSRQQPRAATVLELSVSKDGRAIVDQNGKVIARFVKGKRVQMSVKGMAADARKLPGCMCCATECIVYDSNGNCVQSYQSCTWDFECSCR